MESGKGQENLYINSVLQHEVAATRSVKGGKWIRGRKSGASLPAVTLVTNNNSGMISNEDETHHF